MHSTAGHTYDSLRGWAGRTDKLQENRPETPPDLDRSTPRKNPMEKDVPFQQALKQKKKTKTAPGRDWAEKTRQVELPEAFVRHLWASRKSDLGGGGGVELERQKASVSWPLCLGHPKPKAGPGRRGEAARRRPVPSLCAWQADQKGLSARGAYARGSQVGRSAPRMGGPGGDPRMGGGGSSKPRSSSRPAGCLQSRAADTKHGKAWALQVPGCTASARRAPRRARGGSGGALAPARPPPSPPFPRPGKAGLGLLEGGREAEEEEGASRSRGPGARWEHARCKGASGSRPRPAFVPSPARAVTFL